MLSFGSEEIPASVNRTRSRSIPGLPGTNLQITQVRMLQRMHAAGAAVELDGERVAVGPGGAVLIPPGVRHRAVGRMTILNVVVPPFDPADEWFD